MGIPVIGSGGVMGGRDALEFLAIGAAAVQVGTASFVRPRASEETLEEMRVWLAEHGWRRLAEFRGVASAGEGEGPGANGRGGRGARRRREES